MLPAMTLVGLLCESIWLVALTLIAIQFVLICLWSWRRTRPTGRAVRIGFAAIPLCLFLNVMVVTPREQIIVLCRDLAAFVDDGDVEAIARHLAPDIDVEGRSRDELLDRVRDVLTRHRVDQPRLFGFEVVLPDAETAVAVFDATCRIRSPDALYDWLRTRWRVRFRCAESDTGASHVAASATGTDWLVTQLEVLPTPLSPLRSLRELLTAGGAGSGP